MGDRRESKTRLEGGRRKLAFNLSVAHQDINGSGQNAVSPGEEVGSFLMVEGFSLGFRSESQDLRASWR